MNIIGIADLVEWLCPGITETLKDQDALSTDCHIDSKEFSRLGNIARVLAINKIFGNYLLVGQ